KRQVLTIRYETAITINNQATAIDQEKIGSPAEKCTTAATTPAPAGIGMPTKYFFPGRPGFEGCGFIAMLKRASRLAPAIKNRKLAIAPNCTSLLTTSVEVNKVESRRKPHIQASRAGATPKVMTSASESSSRPKSLLVWVMRAMRPSSPSNRTAKPMALAALSKCHASAMEPCVTCKIA